ncbi:MAG: DUF2007 domain-containing protein [Bryobacteraceae bacterium]
MDQHPLELVTVLEVSDSFALRLATSALDDAGIDYVVSGDQPRYLAGIPGSFGVGETPLCNCCCQIQVARENESAARELLDPLLNPDPAAPE